MKTGTVAGLLAPSPDSVQLFSSMTPKLQPEATTLDPTFNIQQGLDMAYADVSPSLSLNLKLYSSIDLNLSAVPSSLPT